MKNEPVPPKLVSIEDAPPNLGLFKDLPKVASREQALASLERNQQGKAPLTRPTAFDLVLTAIPSQPAPEKSTEKRPA
ncbi:MAG: hypothetical protein U1F67_09040 [Rubrivivax sp.]